MQTLRRISEQRERLERIHHRRENGAEAILAIETREHPFLRAAESVPTKLRGNEAVEAAGDAVQAQEDARQPARASGATEIVSLPLGRSGEQLTHVYVAGIACASL